MKLIKKAGLVNQSCPWLDREWLETDGRGGYCSTTVPLCNTRKYHGLLVTPLENQEGRFVLLSGYEISVTDNNGKTWRLDTGQYPGVIYPAGYVCIEEFENSIFPSWTFRCGTGLLRMEIFMAESGGVFLSLENASGKEYEKLRIMLTPVIAFRDSHSLTRENSALGFSVKRDGHSYSMGFYSGMPLLVFTLTSQSAFRETGYWLKNREYLREMERGFDFREDCFTPGSFLFEIEAGKREIIRAALERPQAACCSGSEADALFLLRENEVKSRKTHSRLFRGEPAVIRVLKQESRHFLVRNRDNNLSVIAGYPWFGEWGRDTMISMAGLTICCGKTGEALEILKSYASYIRDGLIPNTLGGAQGYLSYNSIDAGLLYIMASRQFFETGRERKEFRNQIFPAIAGIVRAYLENRVPGLTFSSEGFPEAGDDTTQLTWMDAKSRGRAVTPRGGSPVEITALYYNALRFYLELSDLYGLKKDFPAAEAADRIERNFIGSYWFEKGGYLADVVRSGKKDTALRPNMLFAVSLPFPLVDREKGKKIIETAEKALLTSCGIRTLSPGDSRFCPVYDGDGEERDSRYHQGTVWPWLFGIYTDAALYSSDDRKAKAEEIGKLLLSFLEKHIDECCIGSVSEIFDGLNPSASEGKGACAQAWSAAEIIRAWEKTRQALQ